MPTASPTIVPKTSMFPPGNSDSLLNASTPAAEFPSVAQCCADSLRQARQVVLLRRCPRVAAEPAAAAARDDVEVHIGHALACRFAHVCKHRDARRPGN